MSLTVIAIVVPPRVLVLSSTGLPAIGSQAIPIGRPNWARTVGRELRYSTTVGATKRASGISLSTRIRDA